MELDKEIENISSGFKDINESNENEIEFDEEERLKRDFKDFIVFPKISGRNNPLGDSNYIPSEKIVERNDTVEIANTYPSESEHSDSSTVMVVKDENGEITQIEVLCDCGNKTVIRFDYT